MKKYKCNVAQKGFFAGPVYGIGQEFTETESIEMKAGGNAADELKRFEEACRKLKESINGNNGSEKNEGIRKIVLSLVEDEAFTRKVNECISEGNSAEASVKKASENLSAELESIESEYIRSRQEDIHGIALKLIAILKGVDEKMETCSAVCAMEISPAQLSSVNEALIGALLTDKGSPNSHASILAGNLDIPYLYGSKEAVEEAVKCSFVIIDSETGTVTIEPDEQEKQNALLRMEKLLKEKAEKIELEKKNAAENVKTRTKVYANIAGPEDIKELLESGADGVGLFRTEFLFLNSKEIPSEETQYEAYRAVLEAMGEKEVIIRTMDIGSDKTVSWLNLPEEINPALGLRGVRVSLEKPELFKTQLRALLKAAVTGNLKVMFPMITAAWEIDEINERIKETAEELEREGAAYKIPDIGIMIETPAAAVCAEELSEKVKFFSIGTNDLTQYSLALDRESQGLGRYFKPHHEAIFKLIGMTAQGGHKNGIPTGVCGQLAADSEAVKRLINEGVDELSVPVKKVRVVKLLAAKAESELEKEAEENENKEPEVFAVADGKFIPMKDIPDEVFSKGSMGECYGILPENGKIYSPVDGTVKSIAETGHAIVLKTEGGREILVHAGINTVTLGNAPFKHFVKEGDKVKVDQLIMEANLEMIKKASLSTVIVVISLK